MHAHTTTRSMIQCRLLAAIAAAVLAVAFATTSAFAQERSDHDAHHQQDAAKPINAMCPIGKEPIVASAGTVTYKGKTIGLCCPPCGKDFLAWDEAKRDEFVAMALAGKEPGPRNNQPGQQQEAAQHREIKSDPYLLDTCPVTGQKLGLMGDPVVKMIAAPGADRFPHFAGEREVRFCCAGCVEKFEADKEKHFAEIDKKLIEQQLPYYPLDTCVVMEDSKLGDPEMGEPVNLIYKNRLVRFCCRMCVRDFNKDPQKFLTKLDNAIIEKQRAHYPLDTCTISGQKLGSMGEPAEKVYGNRLVRFCCEACVVPFEKDPTPHRRQLDKAWKDSGHRPGAAGNDAHHDHND